MGKAAYERGNKALRRGLDEEYQRNPHTAASRAITFLENRIALLEERSEALVAENARGKADNTAQAARIVELEAALSKAQRNTQFEHEQFLRWFRHAEDIRLKWIIQSKVIRTALTPDEYHLARDIVKEYDGV